MIDGQSKVWYNSEGAENVQQSRTKEDSQISCRTAPNEEKEARGQHPLASQVVFEAKE